MGAVYKPRQKQLDRIVALKILPPEVASGPGFADRFTREARALAKLNHPHIVTLYEFGQSDGLFYFLMEFVDGLNLRLLLEAPGRLRRRRRWRLCRRFARRSSSRTRRGLFIGTSSRKTFCSINAGR